MADPPDRLEEGREALRRFLAGDEDLTTMLTKIALIATEAVPGCDLASITLLRRGHPTTPVFTDKAALELDEAQYHAGDGPCLSAIRHRGTETSTTATDERWPSFRAAAERLGVLATLSVPLGNEETVLGGVNLYSTSAPSFPDSARAVANAFADQLGVAAANAAAYAEGYELAAQLEEAMQSRAVIEQAKGILMVSQECSADEAFEILKRASQNQNRKLREIATEIVERRSRRAPAGG